MTKILRASAKTFWALPPAQFSLTPAVPEWEEFPGRMARAADDAEAAPVSAEDRRRWQAYRDATVRLAREKVAIP